MGKLEICSPGAQVPGASNLRGPVQSAPEADDIISRHEIVDLIRR
jgi:hypothetical protein